jgi:probable rRNA maturation factor
MSLNVEITVEAGDWSAFGDLEDLTTRAVEAAAESSEVNLLPGAEVSVLFTDDAHGRALNAAWRSIDKATNVLSFPSGMPVEDAALLGDIVIASETVTAEAEDQHKKPADHLAHLIVHGFLHLVGFDHEIDAEAQIMEDLERTILARLGIADPYRDALCHELE